MQRFARDTQKQSPSNTQLRNRQLSNLEQRENQVYFPINVAHSVVDCCTARSPHMRHPSDFGAFQRNATQGMGIAGDHDPTAHQLRKQIHARSARQVAGSSQSVEDRLSRTEMFTDSKRETQLRSNGELHPKPMNYEHEMHFVHLQDILFSQTDINLKEKPTTINQIKCHTYWFLHLHMQGLTYLSLDFLEKKKKWKRGKHMHQHHKYHWLKWLMVIW